MLKPKTNARINVIGIIARIGQAAAIMGIAFATACGPSQKNIALIQAELDAHPLSQRVPNGTVCTTYRTTDDASLARLYADVPHIHIQRLKDAKLGPVTLHCQYYTWDTETGVEQAPPPIAEGGTTAQTSYETIGKYVVDSIVSEQPQNGETVIVFNEHFEANELGKALDTPALAQPPQAKRDNVQAVITMNAAGKPVAEVASIGGE
jgi:hypothetical protein